MANEKLEEQEPEMEVELDVPLPPGYPLNGLHGSFYTVPLVGNFPTTLATKKMISEW